MVNYICLRYSIKQKVKSHLRITKYIFGLKLRKAIIMKTIGPLNLLSLGAKYDTRLSPWDMALLGLLQIQIYANSTQQLIKHGASSMMC